MLETVLDRLHQSSPPDHDSEVVIVTQTDQSRVWKHAIAQVFQKFQKQHTVLSRRISLATLRDIRKLLDSNAFANSPSTIFLVDDTSKGVERRAAIDVIRLLPKDRGHRLFMCRESLPGFEEFATSKPVTPVLH